MKVLVTGASGFVGSTLSDRLIREGHEVRLLLRPSSSRANLGEQNFRAVSGDLRQAESLAEAVSGVDIIFHVAGLVAAPFPEDYFAANEAGTRNLLEATRRFNPGLKRFVLVSSLAAAGASAPGRPRVETDAENPISIYGRSKLAGERAVAEFPELPTVILRPPVVYGPRDRGMLTFFQVVKFGILPLLPTPAGTSVYSLIHVEDLVQALMKLGLAEKKFPAGEIFYAAGPGEFSWEETMRALALAFDRRARRVTIPLGLLAAVAKFLGWLGRATKKTFPLNDDKINEIRNPYWHCSNAKLVSEVGFKPVWSLPAGFRQTLSWYRERGWL